MIYRGKAKFGYNDNYNFVECYLDIELNNINLYCLIEKNKVPFKSNANYNGWLKNSTLINIEMENDYEEVLSVDKSDIKIKEIKEQKNNMIKISFTAKKSFIEFSSNQNFNTVLLRGCIPKVNIYKEILDYSENILLSVTDKNIMVNSENKISNKKLRCIKLALSLVEGKKIETSYILEANSVKVNLIDIEVSKKFTNLIIDFNEYFNCLKKVYTVFCNMNEDTLRKWEKAMRLIIPAKNSYIEMSIRALHIFNFVDMMSVKKIKDSTSGNEIEVSFRQRCEEILKLNKDETAFVRETRNALTHEAIFLDECLDKFNKNNLVFTSNSDWTQDVGFFFFIQKKLNQYLAKTFDIDENIIDIYDDILNKGA